MEKTYMPDFINADFAVICQTDGLRRFRIQNGDLVYISVAAEIKDGDVVAVQLFGSKAVYLVEVNFTDEGMNWSVDGGFGLIVTPKDREHGDVRLLGKAVAFTATPGDGEPIGKIYGRQLVKDAVQEASGRDLLQEAEAAVREYEEQELHRPMIPEARRAALRWYISSHAQECPSGEK